MRLGLRADAAAMPRRQGPAGSGVLDEGALAAKAHLSQDIEQGNVVPPGIDGTDTQPSGQ